MTQRIGLLAICLATLSLIWPSSVHSQTVVFQDDFNDGEASNWQVQRNFQFWDPSKPCMNQGVPTTWEVINGWFGITIHGSPCQTEVIPMGVDLSNLPAFEYEYDWSLPESIYMDRNGLFLWHDANNWYDVKLFGERVTIVKVIGGREYFLPINQPRYPFEANHQYHFKVRYTADKKIQVWIDGQQVLNVQDEAPFFTGFRTVGLQASVGNANRSVSFFDNIVVRSVGGEQKLSVPILKQTDPLWADHEYDSAKIWSQLPTIKRWGCAITSTAMIMQFHGLQKLPDGTALTPDSLNSWLKSQSDGYLGEGLVNWAAVTRLTRLISERWQTVKLEYGRSNGTELGAAKQQLEAGKPVMLQVDGHFLVGTGVADAGNDLFINDPAYTYQRFSQHQKPLLSTRTFTPSHTDLSYLVLAHRPTLQLSLENEQGSVVELQTGTDSLADPVDTSGELSSPFVVSELAKPAAGVYTATLTQPEFGPAEITMYAYDQQANLSDLSPSLILGPLPLSLSITYSSTGPSTITQRHDFTQLRSELAELYRQRLIKKSYIYSKLDRLAEYGERLDLHNQQRILAALAQATIDNPHISVLGQQYLQQQYGAIEQSL